MQTTDNQIADAYEYKSQTEVKTVPGGAQSSNIFLSLKPLKSDFTEDIGRCYYYISREW